MTHSESIKGISGALLIFHKEMHAVKKTETNPFFKSKFADLSTILKEIKEPLQKAGLSFSQLPDGDGLTTLLMHSESGEWLCSTMKLVLAKQDPQGQGSGISYAKRYSLSAILGLATEDDDAEKATVRTTAQTTSKGFDGFMNDMPQEQAPAVALGDKNCETCQKSFKPKADWAKDCFDCYKAKNPR